MKHNDLNFSPLTLGTWVFGGQGWGGVNKKDCIEAIHCALDLGVKSFDTAPIYGFGSSENILGEALGRRRKDVIVATKCGLRVGGEKSISHDLSAAFVREEVENSLRRLKTDYIDLYQCHWPDPQVSIQETMLCLLDLQLEGKIRYIGLSNFNIDQIEEARKFSKIVTTQNPYSLLARAIEKDILPYAQNQNIDVLVYGSLAGGVLSGKYDMMPTFKGWDVRKFFYKFYEGDVFKQITNSLDVMRTYGKPLNQIALNWLRQQQGVTSVLVGCRNRKQVESNMAALKWDLSLEQCMELNNLFRGIKYE